MKRKKIEIKDWEASGWSGFLSLCHRHIYGFENSTLKTGPTYCCFELCKYKKSATDPFVYRSYYSELLDCFTDLTFMFIDGLKDGDKTAAAFICPSFEFSKRIPDKASIFAAELGEIVSAFRYIKSTTKSNKFVIFGDPKSALQALLSKWDHPTV